MIEIKPGFVPNTTAKNSSINIKPKMEKLNISTQYE